MSLTSIAILFGAINLIGNSGLSQSANPQDAKFYSFSAKTIDGEMKSMADYKGKVVLVVNVASKCVFTPQYKDLEALYRKYKDRGFIIVGFPSNDFLWQESGTDKEIKSFCTSTYGVTFDLFSKTVVKGEGQNSLYRYLTNESPFPGTVKWNFQKYLLDREGNVVAKFSPSTKPFDDEVVKKLEELLLSRK
ncbi:MAG: glutathione peroxidase [Ignavibacteriales bacterium]|nr:glutathione peroxidase [Ignavibacteriales bacterium]